MAFQWFPGHMHKTRKEIAQVIAKIDVVVEMLDARLPCSSSNPLVDQLRGDTPVIKVLNKADLADAGRTRKWLKFLAADDVHTMSMRLADKGELRQLVALIRQLAPHRISAERPVRVMIMGIPNVGKSTLINSFLGRRVAKVGNEPAVTKQQQRFVTQDGIAIFDTPGILWPKIEDEDASYRLAASGAIRDTVVEYELVALYALDFLLRDYPQLIAQRYKADELPANASDALELVGRKRGCLRSGGVVDRNKAAELLIGELRSGQLGRISFETVGEWQQKRARAERERMAAEAEQDNYSAAAENTPSAPGEHHES
ncbi:ribosome biogenesis GTPase YlqF [Motiliproteus sediminis]|uniref:ribosome biogenesis GTPase YlqF n=1 Tax=Motiliproteus sediminis TaxID=1468178 RepID=UPI001AEFA5B4|nr:ribosome biogenesis GTPase YlqF [Motiliproteus sediminis]